MFSLKSNIPIFSKLKQITVNTRRVRLNHVVCGACFVALVWACCWPDAGSPYVPKHLRKFLRFAEDFTIPEKQLNDTQLKQIIAKIEEKNLRVEITNWEMYQPVNAETTILVIHVHKDVERLQYLIISLGQVRYIHQVLLIFSHSYYDDIINALIKSIDFCKVMQIFYPFSLQLYPNKFPGVDPDDCNVTSRQQAGALGAGSDPGCLVRDARRTQHKQHWWWTANYLFEGLDFSSDKQVVMFLEEDNYVLPDLLHMLKYARRMLPYFPTVEVMSFGRPHAEDLEFDLLMIDAWTPPYDKGLAFNKSTWHNITAHSSLYCFYDDCSWSYSLVHVFANFSGGFAEMAACSAPRVLSTSVFASGRRAVRWAWRTGQRAQLFPERVRAAVTVGVRGRVRRTWRAPPRDNGGWSDLRDQVLCLDPLMTTTPETTTETALPYKYDNKNDPIVI